VDCDCCLEGGTGWNFGALMQLRIMEKICNKNIYSFSFEFAVRLPK
jgi:hypothetical protein